MKLYIDEEYWKKIVEQYNLSDDYIDNGSCWVYCSVGKEEFRTMLVFLSLWLRINDKQTNNTIRFGITGPLSFAVFAANEQTNYHIIFKNEVDYNSFNKFYNSFQYKDNIFDRIPNGKHSNITSIYYPMSTDGAKIDPNTFEIGKVLREHDADVFCWLKKNCQGKYYKYGEILFFENESDAVHFKLSMLKE